MATKKIVTDIFHIRNAESFYNEIVNQEASAYVFLGRHIPYESDDAIITEPKNSIQSSVYDIYNNMMFGKRISNSDISYMIKRNEWTENTVYDMYDHEDENLSNTENYFVYTQTGSNINVYKCLDNNRGSNSTVEPTGTDSEPFFTPSDGYVWKYIYTVTEAVFNKFKTTNFMPLTPNTSVIANAINGAIEHINIDDVGRGYDNYIETAEFRVDDITVNGDLTLYGITDTANSSDNYYTGCVIKITSGTAAGEYRKIIDYNISGGQKIITIENPFTNTPSSADTYEIYPFVYVYGDGNETANCEARAIIDPDSSNSIQRIEILSSGSDYRYAEAYIIPTAVVDVEQEAILRPIISPPGGHGSDPVRELNAKRIGISVKYSNTENGLFSVDNDFRTIGIIRNPEFQNVEIAINLSNTVGSFIVGEYVNQYRDIVLSGTVECNTSTETIVGTDTYFDTSLVVGDTVHLTNGVDHFFSKVETVTNATHISLESTVTWNGSGSTISLVNSTPYGIVTATSTGMITVSNLNSGTITTQTRLYGNSSYTISQVNTAAALPISVSGNEITGLFEKYIEMGKFVGTTTSSNTTIIEDAQVRQESVIEYTQPTAYFHSWANSETNDVMYLTNIKNIFNQGEEIINESNTVTFDLSTKYMGDLVRDSGDILYIENVDPISRGSNKSETIKITLEF